MVIPALRELKQKASELEFRRHLSCCGSVVHIRAFLRATTEIEIGHVNAVVEVRSRE